MSLIRMFMKLKYLMLVLCLIVVYVIFVEAINDKVGLLYLRIVNTESVKIGNVTINIPYRYVRKIQQSDVTFTDFPDGEGTVIIRSQFVYDFDIYVDNYVKHVESANCKIVETGKVTIGGEKGYLIKSDCSSNKHCQEITILVPDKHVMINYQGSYDKWDDYFVIMHSIRFE